MTQPVEVLYNMPLLRNDMPYYPEGIVAHSNDPRSPLYVEPEWFECLYCGTGVLCSGLPEDQLAMGLCRFCMKGGGG